MKIANTRFEDPRHLGEPSNIFVDTMLRFELLDYARRYFERKGDKSSISIPFQLNNIILLFYPVITSVFN